VFVNGSWLTFVTGTLPDAVPASAVPASARAAAVLMSERRPAPRAAVRIRRSFIPFLLLV